MYDDVNIIVKVNPRVPVRCMMTIMMYLNDDADDDDGDDVDAAADTQHS